MFKLVSNVSADIFRAVLGEAREESPMIAEFTSAPEDMPSEATYYVSEDGRSGFGVHAFSRELVGLFSLEKGRGHALVKAAIAAGAVRLDCFDGYLPSLYARYGFVETSREANWTPGGPDVVFMALGDAPARVGAYFSA